MKAGNIMKFNRVVKALLKNLFIIFPIQKNKILFDNFFGKGYGDNPKYILEALNDLNDNFDFVWCLDDMKNNIPDGVRKVKIFSWQYYFECATSKVWIDNIRNNTKTKKRKKQLYIQTWHGSVGFKAVEGEVEKSLSPKYIKAAKHDGMITNAIISSNSSSDILYKNYFWLNNNCKILKFGNPRNDLLINQAKNNNINRKVRDKFNININNLLVLYAPTFRDDNSTKGYIQDFTKIIESLKRKFGKKVNVIVRFHPNIADSNYVHSFFLNNSGLDVINGCNYSDQQELLVASDILISDYSSIQYDFLLLKKIVFSYMSDLEEYKKLRPLNKNINRFPFIFTHSIDDLISKIDEFDNDTYLNNVNEYFKKYPSYDKGNAAQLVAEWIVNEINKDR